MLAERHEFDVVVAVFPDVLHQLRCDLLVGVPAVFVVGIGHPRAKVHLVDVDGLVPVVAALFHPASVVEGVAGEITDNGGVVGAQLHAESVGVAVVDGLAVGVLRRDAVLVHLSGQRIRHGDLIDTAVMNACHGHRLPLAALPDQGDSFGIGRKGAEHHAVPGDVCPEIGMCIKGISQKKLMDIHERCNSSQFRSLSLSAEFISLSYSLYRKPAVYCKRQIEKYRCILDISSNI